MIHISRSAIAANCLLAALLLVPALGVCLQDERALQNFHGRALSAWPDLATCVADPVVYFKNVKSWVADRVFPIQQATHARANLFYLLGSPPEPRVTLGTEGFVFLNGGTNQTTDSIFATTCVDAHQQRAADFLERTFASKAASILAARARPIDVIAVPTPSTLYGDKLPSDVAPIYRQACLDRVARRSPLLSVRATAPVSFFYPLTEMLAARDGEGFYPKGNYHPLGWSLKLIRDGYLARRQVSAPVDEEMALGHYPSEVLSMSGVFRDMPVHFIQNPNVTERHRKNAVLARWINSLFVRADTPARVYTNTHPLLEERVLMLSDSYGEGAAKVFAGAFRQVTQVTTNYLLRGQMPRLIERIDHVEPFDRLIILFQEGNVYNISEWLAH
jgi:hypothetical protein